jgi:hypothetical protein
MNAQLFTDAMSELNDKYVMEAVSYQRKSKPQFNTWLSKVACVFLAVLLTGSAVLTFSVEARAAFFGWVREQVETYYMYFFEGNAAVTEPAKYELGWMPENCIFVTSYETAGGEVYIYTDERDTLIQFTYTSEPDNEKVYVDYAEYTEKQVTINGNTASLFIAPSEDNTDGIVWTDPNTNALFFISGHFDQETFIKIAENVKEKN